MDTLANARHQAFSVWLRTGRLPLARSFDSVEFKFNPWHDVATGRFTFTGTGRQAGGWMGGGFTGGGGGRTGGGGATGTWKPAEKHPKVQASRSSATQAGRRAGPAAAKTPETLRTPRVIRMLHQAASPAAPNTDIRPAPAPRSPAAPKIRLVRKNGYEYRIDETQRTVGMTGTLTLSASPVRSRTAQAHAGGADRRGTDDGGHYIAARFNGPTDAFNHFAQDRNFNRGAYRALEDQWAAAIKNGMQVSVRITPSYNGASMRPSRIHVRFSIDGKSFKHNFPNKRQETQRAKH